GGSLIPHCGHNPLEAVAHGAAVLTGPSFHNFADEYAALKASDGVIVTATAGEIRSAVAGLYANPSARADLTRNAAIAVDVLKGALA
ncbi:hypothetical protein ACO1NA_14325, partial [Staphylococcus aureus]